MTGFRRGEDLDQALVDFFLDGGRPDEVLRRLRGCWDEAMADLRKIGLEQIGKMKEKP